MLPIDLLFPKLCVGCGGEGSWWCADCFGPYSTQKAWSCADCDRLTSDGRYCRLHVNKHEIKGLLYCDTFHRGMFREAVHNLKYNGVQELALPLGTLLYRRLETWPHLENAILLPIPLHPSRFSERGFNQAELLARATGLDVNDEVLVRYRATIPQATLSREKRIHNIQSVFGVLPQYLQELSGRTVILVDDVTTTGATLDSAALVLKKAGIKTVWALTVAKG